MRKIRKDEIGKVSRLFTDIFAEYEAYRLFFPDEKKLAKGMEAFFRYEIFASQDYTWVEEDFLSAAAVKCPGDKDHDPRLLFLSPVYTLSFFTAVGAHARKLRCPRPQTRSGISALCGGDILKILRPCEGRLHQKYRRGVAGERSGQTAPHDG